ncbi:hypothetical protein ACWDGI_41715 [Streptomyces sp. NPDC001220]
MNKGMIAAAVAAVFLVAGCAGGGDGGGSSAKSTAAKAEANPEATECFVGVIKALRLVFGKVKGDTPAGTASEEEAFAEFGVKAQGTPTWDIHEEYQKMGVRELAQGQRATTVDALAAYAPSVKKECVQAYSEGS